MKQGDPSTNAPWAFTGGAEAPPPPPKQGQAAPPPRAPVQEAVGWTASEYVSHHKGGSWYVLLFFAIVILTGLVYLIARDVMSTVVVAIFGLFFALYAAREPDVLEYVVDAKGIHMGTKFYPYNIFRSFSIMQEDGLHSILLMPQKRFSLPVTVYYDPNDEEQIVGVIGSHLPHEERKVPVVDRLMSKIHF